MRHVILFRHAKSSWDNVGLDDFDRPLSKRGTTDAPRMGAYIARHLPKPNWIVCSTAVRTRQTLALIQKQIGIADDVIQFEPDIYEAPPARILSCIRALSDQVETVLIIGHNPGLQAIAMQLTGSGEPELTEKMTMKFPTAAVAALSFDVKHWCDIAPHSGCLDTFMVPKRLPA